MEIFFKILILICDIDIKIRLSSTIHDDLSYPSFIDRTNETHAHAFFVSANNTKRVLSSR